MQADLFDNSEILAIKDEIVKVKSMSDNVRRGLFARHNELAKLYIQQQTEIDELKAALYGKKQENSVFI